ncbi:hypothetical protein [Roseibacillus ishigakijimensis]|uniref:Uncharacterized protein n=1 Tax=Roseibacillus ishigakijimensis TaxID=454146 RepID=A0A934RSR8_9BACT|nr:hypothetical protein [Roseibacillus ishigakijimensis]
MPLLRERNHRPGPAHSFFAPAPAIPSSSARPAASQASLSGGPEKSGRNKGRNLPNGGQSPTAALRGPKLPRKNPTGEDSPKNRLPVRKSSGPTGTRRKILPSSNDLSGPLPLDGFAAPAH